MPLGNRVNSGEDPKLARRRYQRGSVQLRNGVWTGRFLEDVRFADGRTERVHRRVYLGTQAEIPTKKLALRRLEPFLAEINSFTYRPKNVISLTEFLVKWEETVLPQYEEGTVRNFRYALKKYLVPAFGSQILSEIQPEQIQIFISRLSTGASNARNVIKCFRAIWKRAKAWGYVKHDPFADLMLPKLKTHPSRYFTPDEINRILGAAPEPYKTLYWILSQTGLRIGEALALTKEQANPQTGLIVVKGKVWRGQLKDTVKSASARRTIPISPRLREHLSEYIRDHWQENPSNLLFTNSVGRPMRADWVLATQFRPLLDHLGIEKAGFHAFRHTSATILDQIQAPLKVRQDRLGHAKAEMTLNIYTHVQNEEAVRIAERFDEVIGL
jgi:integrase